MIPNYTPSLISAILSANQPIISDDQSTIRYISCDTRTIVDGSKTCFFAIKGSMQDGHIYITKAISLGVCNIICEDKPIECIDGVNYYFVKSALSAMQVLAGHHRQQFNIPVIGITGSNGKTTIKEWLYLMIDDRKIVKSPKSYNSQIGCPLSVWQMSELDEMAIFEAGISTVGEMKSLAQIIKPTLGILTNIGDAHDAGFHSKQQKLDEKLDLFDSADTILYCSDDPMIHTTMETRFHNKRLLTWGTNGSFIKIVSRTTLENGILITLSIKDQNYQLALGQVDDAFVENCLHCVATCTFLGFSWGNITAKIAKLHNLPMRLEMKSGENGNIIINDSYNADLQSLAIALQFMEQQAGQRNRVLIISDFEQLDLTHQEFAVKISEIATVHNVKMLIHIGVPNADFPSLLSSSVEYKHYNSTESFLHNTHSQSFQNQAILVKGARRFGLERVVKYLSQRKHTTVLETDLQAIDHNLRFFSDKLSDKTQLIAIIKASAYGSGSAELARFLAFRNIASLAVAYVDEGIFLRQNNIHIPIIILNPDSAGINDMIGYDLEPEINGMEMLQEWVDTINANSTKSVNIHLKLDTGMHRLGFEEEQLTQVVELLLGTPNIKVKSIFSHLSASEDSAHDDFTHQQANLFESMVDYISGKIGYKPLRHLLNSSGILRFPQYHYEWVRLGLGMYGIDSTGQFNQQLEKAHTLKASVIQVKSVKAGETVGYNRRGIVAKDTKIAIINIGYADGLMRKAGHGSFSIAINGKLYPTIGSVCMDLTMINIGFDSIKVGDEVIIFGKNKPIEDLAMACETIPYEIISTIAPRVKRIYTQS